MATTYTWKILHLERIIEQDSLSDIIATAHWVLEGKDENNRFGRQYGIQQLRTDSVDSSSFTSFDQVTESQVISWVQAALNDENHIFKEDYDTFVDFLKGTIQTQIDDGSLYRNTGVPW